MIAPRTDRSTRSEELLARLTAAAYGVALRHGLCAPFIDVELDLWRELRNTLTGEPLDTLELPVVPRAARREKTVA